MQNIQISDDVALALREIAEREHISSVDLIAKLVTSYKMGMTKRDELRSFFKNYQKDMSGYAFNREESNER